MFCHPAVPRKIKRDDSKQWGGIYFLSLPVVSVAYINSKSKRGSGGIKAPAPPKDNKELRCEGERRWKENEEDGV